MKAQINDTEIFYTESGDPTKTSVVFIHGFPFSHAIWQKQIKALGDDFHCIAYDFRGMGESCVGDGQYSLEGHVDDLVALLDFLQIDQAVIVGLSMGGYIALRALQRNPERFLAVALCDTRSEEDDNAARIKRANAAQSVKKEGAAAFAEGFLPAVFSEASITNNVPGVGMIKQIISKNAPLAIAGNLIAMAARTDTTASLKDIAVPTLILVGEKDKLTTPEDARNLQNQIKGSVLHVVPDAAHLSNLENPEFFNARLLEFLHSTK
ncbi:alpha/beta fold hydrolase [Desulfuromonas acetoxidans]|uniref:Alpha/beta hydrolase fold n=1 Tax=Desulfuromonas acetoxidans (strain DSM 684 / 11070) TaxID=281689 RepID=Q1JYN8_DESA6|nr:alpha/beta hydrolase [Desulfuromonas acetoxidans]EAT15377.1 alpha/beta hydrolase fold [Desulfuromonas acetoxidans DSM 684]MBF0646213.1 alpha/beta fold hydrolase [Desulfuromonas acetoxidans]NVD24408.1 alpha/beta fold hydrolase [Desulfuromonas acetoxidans]NVE16644.1 alpha/beta fold hydrolase [Desulfuromonas acetoxidans]